MLGQSTKFLNIFEQALQAELSDLDGSTEEKNGLLDSYASYFLQHFNKHTKAQNSMLLWLLDGPEGLQTAKNHILTTLLDDASIKQTCLQLFIKVFNENEAKRTTLSSYLMSSTPEIQKLLSSVFDKKACNIQKPVHDAFLDNILPTTFHIAYSSGIKTHKVQARQLIEKAQLIDVAFKFLENHKTPGILYSELFSLYSVLTTDNGSWRALRSTEKQQIAETNSTLSNTLLRFFPDFILKNLMHARQVLNNINIDKIGPVATKKPLDIFYPENAVLSQHPNLCTWSLRLKKEGVNAIYSYKPTTVQDFIWHMQCASQLLTSPNLLKEGHFFFTSPDICLQKDKEEQALFALWQHAHTLWHQGDAASQAKATTLMNCMRGIDTDYSPLSQHREQWKPIVANIALCLIGGFVLYGLGLLLRHAWQRNSPKKNTTQQHTLPFWETESEKRLKAVQTATATASAA